MNWEDIIEKAFSTMRPRLLILLTELRCSDAESEICFSVGIDTRKKKLIVPIMLMSIDKVKS